MYGVLNGRENFRPVESVDPYDNVTTYEYWPNTGPFETAGRLKKVRYPDGIDECWNYSPSWVGTAAGCWSSAAFSGVEVTYEDATVVPPAPLPARTYGLLFQKSMLAGSRPFAGDVLWRVYNAKEATLDDLAQGDETYTLPAGLIASERHVVYEMDYYSGTQMVKMVSHRLIDGFFANSDQGVAVPIVAFEYGTVAGVARVKKEQHFLEDITYDFAYTPDISAGHDGWIDRVVRTDSLGGQVERLLDDQHRVVEENVTPPAGVAGRPRAADPDNGGFSEPVVLTTKYQYSECGGCSSKPTVIEQLPSGRRMEMDYDPITGLMTHFREMNPTGAPGLVETTLVWEADKPGLPFAAWRLASVLRPDGTHEIYTYESWPRNTPAGRADWGVKTHRVTAVSSVVTLANNQTTTVSHEKVYNVANPPVNGSGRQVALVGQLVKEQDGDGLVTAYGYDSFGLLMSRTDNPGGGANEIVTSYTLDRWGVIATIVNNATSSVASTTIFESDGVGRLTRTYTTVAGQLLDTRLFYDRWGNLSVTLRRNKTSTGAAPDDFGSSAVGASPRPDVAREWLRDEQHYRGDRLITELRDRRTLDRNDGSTTSDDAPYAREDFVWSPRGQIVTHVHANNSATSYTYDGYGTLYKAERVSVGQPPLLVGKWFVNIALEVVRSYRGGAGLALATTINRYPNGVVASIVEPTVSAPAGYPWATESATHTYTWDNMGRLVESATSGSGGVLARTKHFYDALSRRWKTERFEGAATQASQTFTTLWSGQSKAVRETGPAGRFVELTYDSAARVIEVLRSAVGQAPANPDKLVVEFEPRTNFVRWERSRSWDEAASPPAYVSRDVEYQRDPLGRMLKMKVWPTAVSPSVQPLEHEFAYYSTGNTESYKDPEGKVERYLPDALGRLAERFRPGAQPIWNESRYFDVTTVADRTELRQRDGRGRVTRTVFDFAGRSLFILEPGAATEPTSGSPHQPLARLMAYDAASRLSDIFLADGVRLQLHRDALGRVLMRSRVPTATNSPLVSWAYGRDEIRWNALGQMTEQISRSGLGLNGVGDTYVREYFQPDPLGRLREERFEYTGAANQVEIESSFSGGDPFRTGLVYKNNLSNGADDLWMQYSPDAVGKMAGVQWKSAVAAAWSPLAAYKHEGSAVRSRQTFWGLGQVSPPAPGNFTTTYSFDDYGRMSRIDQSFSAQAFVQFEYDRASNLVKEIYNKQASGRVGDRFRYDEHDRLIGAWMGSNAANMAAPFHDPANPSASNPDNTGTVVQKLTYNLDAANNRSSVITQAGLGAPGVNEAYATQNGAPAGPSNRYDAVGGVQMHYDGRGNTVFDGRFYYIYDALNRLTEVYRLVRTNDDEAQMAGLMAVPPIDQAEEFVVGDVSALAQARGGILSRVVGNPDGIVYRADDPTFVPLLKQAVSPSAVASASAPPAPAQDAFQLKLIAVYLYDCINRRVVRILVDEAVYFYAWDGWQEAQELKHVGMPGQVPLVAKPILQSVWGQELDELVAYRRSAGVAGAAWSNQYIAEGGAHCPSRALGASGQVVEVQEYDPYGRTSWFSSNGSPLSSSAIGNPWAWKGARVDPETALVQMRNRFYSPLWGRFFSVDTIGHWGDIIGRGNGYQYGGNAPGTHSDPLGEQVTVWIGGAGDASTGIVKTLMANHSRNGVHIYSEWSDYKAAAERAARSYWSQWAASFVIGMPCPIPVTLIGHSWGGGNANAMADALGALGVPVNLLVTLDPVAFFPVSKSDNVQEWVNSYSETDPMDWFWPAGALWQAAGWAIGEAGHALGVGSDSAIQSLRNDSIGTVGGQLGAEDGAVNIEVPFSAAANHGNAEAFLRAAFTTAAVASAVSSGILR